MPLEIADLWLAGAVVGASALIIGGIAFLVGVRRRRQHRKLMREAVINMCTGYEVPPIRRLQRELVELLVLQDNGAALLTPAPDPGAFAAMRSMFVRSDPVELVERVFGPIAHRHLVTQAVSEQEEIEAPASVPRVADLDGLERLCAAMHDAVRGQVRLARAIVAAVEPVDEADAAMREAFEADLVEALQGAQRGLDLARAGQPLAALEELTGLALCLPEDGIPGRGVRPYLREQAFELARVAIRHRAAVTEWCATVEYREGRA